MPRVKQLTPALRKEEAERAQRERVIRIINAACAASGEDRQSLAKKAGMDYQQFNRRMRGEADFRMLELCSVADALNLDAAVRASLCGAKQKCRFEAGFCVN